VKEGLISQEMLDRALAVDSKFGEMSDRYDPSLWEDEAVATREEWGEVRRLAKDALTAMGYDLEPPPSHKRFRTVWVRK